MSAPNAVKAPDADPAIAKLRQQYFDRFRPATPDQEFLVDTLVRNEWTLRLLFDAEIKLLSRPAEEILSSEGAKLLGQFQRRVSLAQKSYREALEQLRSVQEDRAASPRVQKKPAPAIAPFADALPSPKPAPWNPALKQPRPPAFTLSAGPVQPRSGV